MPGPTDVESHDTLQGAAAVVGGVVETPFLETTAGPLSGTDEAASLPGMTTSLDVVESPFVSEYMLGGELVDPVGEEFRRFLTELYDEEFDAALLALVHEADRRLGRLGLDRVVPGTAGEVGVGALADARAERMLRAWMEPLYQAADDLVERMAQAMAAEDPTALEEDRIEQILAAVEPGGQELTPAFQDFLGSLRKKATKLAKRAAGLARKGIAAASRVLPVAVVLRKLKPLVRPLLQRVLRLALDRLPATLRPYATQLAQRYLRVPAEVADEITTVDVAGPDVAAVGLRFDSALAELLLAPDEPSQDALLAAEVVTVETEQDDTLAVLDAARQQFVTGVTGLAEGQDPTPLVEEFLPVAALRLGFRVAGRQRVVDFLATYLGRLIAPYVGPKITPALSKAIVDAGLRLMSLEVPDATGWAMGTRETEPLAEAMGGFGPEDTVTSTWEAEATSPRLAAEAFADLVEDVLAEIAELDEELVQDPHLLSAAIAEAGARAAMASFPEGVLHPNGAAEEVAEPALPWIAMPRGGPRRYRKCVRIFDVTVTPRVARAIRTFGGRTLHDHLWGASSRSVPVRTRVHLYQAVPGSRLSRIAQSEAEVIGADQLAANPWLELHPLTPTAAGLLLGEPGLGREAPECCLGPATRLRVGQRFYYLETVSPQTRMPGMPARGATVVATVPVTLAIDVPAGVVRVAVYVGEARAQALAAHLRRGSPLAEVLATLRRIVADGVDDALSGAPRSRLRVVRETPDAAEILSRLLPTAGLSRSARDPITRRLTTWVSGALSRALARDRGRFLAATEHGADGVTVVVHLIHPPGLPQLGRLLGSVSAVAGGATPVGDLARMLSGTPRRARVEIVPGYRRA